MFSSNRSSSLYEAISWLQERVYIRSDVIDYLIFLANQDNRLKWVLERQIMANNKLRRRVQEGINPTNQFKFNQYDLKFKIRQISSEINCPDHPSTGIGSMGSEISLGNLFNKQKYFVVNSESSKILLDNLFNKQRYFVVNSESSKIHYGKTSSK